MIRREASVELLKLAAQFKAVAVIGPRQSGKTTLVRHTFGHKPYVSMENPDTRQFAIEDPRGFLHQFPNGAILDEAQRVPHLFSYLQQILDEHNESGLFIITGSNNFLLQENISQSLAGRIAYLNLLPFSLNELADTGNWGLNELLFKGAYPPIYDQAVETNNWYNNYIRTYIERDVRQLKNIKDLYTFERFIKLCAGRIGQLLNMSNLAIETGVDHKTISSWIGILESSFIIYRLQPHHRNFNKRIVKMPKLYFYDTGLASALLGIQNEQQMDINPYRGSLFENFVITELIKTSFNKAKQSNIYFWRDNTGHEIDAVIEHANELLPIEIKSGKTITSDYFKGLFFWNKLSKQNGGAIVYGGNSFQKRSNGISIFPWNRIGELVKRIY
ncbi:MAG: ATP-binding protein [Bacteroidales bacterium]|nr:ATP-binding protein [Bacteroidales bacterium]